MYRIIETQADIAEGARALIRACPHMKAVHAVTGQPPLRRRPAGFAGLARIVTGQQLSVASASAIWARLEKAVQPLEADAFLRKRQATLRKCGLSAGKVATLTEIARAMRDGRLDPAALDAAREEDIKEALTALKGVGPWTADIYVMFCLGRADAWAPGDLALRYAVRDACGLADAPDEAAMLQRAQAWRPWRGVAARMLWVYYGAQRARKDAQPA